MKLRVGDQVIVTAGKDRGKVGEVMRVLPKKSAVLVKGVNLYKRHVKSREGLEGGIMDLERPLSIAKLAYYDAKSKSGSRVGYTIKDGVKTRIVKKTQQVVAKKASPKAEKTDQPVNKKQTKKK